MKTTREQGDALLDWARRHLRDALGGQAAVPPEGAWGREKAATFVTLRWAGNGRLQGCIGSIEPRQAIVDDVAHNVVAAALYDRRSEPISLTDVDAIDLEVSVLSALVPMDTNREREVLASLRPGTDGVVFQSHGKRALLLPQVWDHVPDPYDFMAEVKMKAGCSPYEWGPDVRVWRFTVDKYIDHAHQHEMVS
jgi:AmmeMemoRadiSam system protein A